MSSEDLRTSDAPLAGAFLYVSVDQAVRMLGIGPTTIYKAIRSGQIRRFKIGRRTLLKVSELQQWIEKSGPLPSNRIVGGGAR